MNYYINLVYKPFSPECENVLSYLEPKQYCVVGCNSAWVLRMQIVFHEKSLIHVRELVA